jgi:hypothetical protein
LEVEPETVIDRPSQAARMKPFCFMAILLHPGFMIFIIVQISCHVNRENRPGLDAGAVSRRGQVSVQKTPQN